MGRRTRLTCGGPSSRAWQGCAPFEGVAKGQVEGRADSIHCHVLQQHGCHGVQKGMEERGVAGELIPIPKQLEAGCGLVWSAPLTARVALTRLLDDPSIVWCERTILELEGL